MTSEEKKSTSNGSLPMEGAVVDDTEEAMDTVASLNPAMATRKREKIRSDVTGMMVPPAGRRKKTVSDISGMYAAQKYVPHHTLKKEGGREGRRRTKSSTDVITKFGQAPVLHYDDLKLAEQVAAYGDATERLVAGGISEADFEEVMEDKEEFEEFEFNHEGLTSEEAAKRLEKYGRNEISEKVTPKWLLFLSQFWAPMPIMIWVAIIIELGIQNFIDMGILLFIQFANASISFYESNKAGNAVAALKGSLKPAATCKRDGKWIVMDAGEIVPGDTVLLASGSAIPADCRVNSSEIDVDQAALTGESLPVTFYKGDSCKMGSTVVRGEVEGTVEFTGADTFFGKTASLLQETHEATHLQKMLMSIMFVLVSLSLTLCVINFIYLITSGVSVKEALSFTIVLLVASIPLAIEIVTTTTLAIGSKALVKHGAIVAKLSAIEDLAGMSILCSDKTGTLTLNQMVLQEHTPIYCEGETQESVLLMAAMAAKWKEPPRDALDRLTLGAVNYSLLEPYEQLDYLPFDPQIKRTEGTVRNTKTGEVFKTSKGAPHIILNLLPSTVVDIRAHVERDVASLGQQGIRSLAVARSKGDSGVWEMIGLLTFLDPPRPDSAQTIKEAIEFGVNFKMITGDHLLIARNTAKQLEMGDRILTAETLPVLDVETKAKPENLARDYGDLCLAADGFAQVYPEHKYLIVECLRELHYTVGMTGDGVNDAPALKRADVGIAVAGATDAARAAADIVLTQEGLSTIVHGIVIAREIFQRMSNFITYRIAATLQLLLFFFIAIFAFHPWDYEPAPGEEWPEFFQMPVLMLMLITLLNDGTLITIAYDYAKANPAPDRWNLPSLFLISSVLAFVSFMSSLLLLQVLLDSWNPNGVIQKLGMDGLKYGQIITSIYLKVSVSDFLTLFSARTRELFFFQVKPAPILLAGGIIALSLSSVLAIVWPEGEQDHIDTLGLQSNMGMFGFVWIFCLIFWFIQDALKVIGYRLMYKYNFNDIATSGVVVLPESALKIIRDWDNEMTTVAAAHH